MTAQDQTLPAELLVTVNGLRLHVAEAGSGPPVLLLHGFPGTSPTRVSRLVAVSMVHPLAVVDAGMDAEAALLEHALVPVPRCGRAG